MVNKSLPLQVSRGSTLLDDQVLMLGDTYVKRLKLTSNQPVALRFGAGRANVRVVPVARLNVLRVSEAVASRLGLQHGGRLCVQFRSSSRTLSVGPLIGVMMSRIYTKNPARPFGATTAFCEELTEACRLNGGQVYFFTPDDLPPESQSLQGWVYSGGWVKRKFPEPDVVYNRLTTRRLENNSRVQQFMREVKSNGAYVFNEKYLNKTEVFQALQRDENIRSYLPESYRLTQYQTLRSMLGKYPVVFLKPATGSLGQGIIRIARQPDSNYAVHTTGMSGTRRQTFATAAQVFSAVSGKIRNRQYQIQQGLRLMEALGRPVDFRALVQRNGSGEWSVTSTVARIAASNHFVSNLARGGTLSTVKDAVAKSNLPLAGRSGIGAKLKRAALDIASSVENQIPAHFAELGIDLAVDQTGKVWLLEVNSKPSKEDNTPLESGKIRPSVRRIVQYAQHLAKF